MPELKKEPLKKEVPLLPASKFSEIRPGNLENLLENHFPGTIDAMNKAHDEFKAHWENKFVNLRKKQGMNPFSLEEAIDKKKHGLIKKELRQWLEVQQPGFPGPEIISGKEPTEEDWNLQWIAKPTKNAFKYEQTPFSGPLVRQLVLKRKGQCVGFTALYTALARRLGLKVHPAQVVIDAEGRRAEYTKTGPRKQLVDHTRRHVFPMDEEGQHYDLTYESKTALGVQHKEVEPLTDKQLVAGMFEVLGANYADIGKINDMIESIKHFEKAAKLDPENTTILANLGHSYVDTHTIIPYSTDGAAYLKNAKIRFKQAMEKNPNNAFAMAGLAKIERIQGKLKKSTRILKQALEINPSDPDILHFMVSNQEYSGNFDKAEEYMDKLHMIHSSKYIEEIVNYSVSRPKILQNSVPILKSIERIYSRRGIEKKAEEFANIAKKVEEQSIKPKELLKRFRKLVEV